MRCFRRSQGQAARFCELAQEEQTSANQNVQKEISHQLQLYLLAMLPRLFVASFAQTIV